MYVSWTSWLLVQREHVVQLGSSVVFRQGRGFWQRERQPARCFKKRSAYHAVAPRGVLCCLEPVTALAASVIPDIGTVLWIRTTALSSSAGPQWHNAVSGCQIEQPPSRRRSKTSSIHTAVSLSIKSPVDSSEPALRFDIVRPVRPAASCASHNHSDPPAAVNIIKCPHDEGLRRPTRCDIAAP